MGVFIWGSPALAWVSLDFWFDTLAQICRKSREVVTTPVMCCNSYLAVFRLSEAGEVVKWGYGDARFDASESTRLTQTWVRFPSSPPFRIWGIMCL